MAETKATGNAPAGHQRLLMSPGVKAFLQRWFVTTLGVLAAATIVDGIHANSALGLLAASLLLGIFNAVLRPLLMLLALPLLIVTLGLFTLVINAVLLYFVGWLVLPFQVADFWSAFKGGLVISVVSLFANLLIGKDESRLQVRRNQPQKPKSPDVGGGPVIDV